MATGASVLSSVQKWSEAATDLDPKVNFFSREV